MRAYTTRPTTKARERPHWNQQHFDTKDRGVSSTARFVSKNTLQIIGIIAHFAHIGQNDPVRNHLTQGPSFFHGFLRPISRAREIENDAFHGQFTG